eukprot:scaffold1160_cov174-Ochromonas_danica.AAC.11
MMFQWKQHRDRLHRAAIVIQKIIRGFMARAYLRDLKRERRAHWIHLARQYVETWSDEYQAWYYYNIDNGETLWEPRREGYTKSDGQLVLMSGEVIDDPTTLPSSALNELLGAVEDGKIKKEGGGGARRRHHYETLGPRDCEECELILAERYCVSCDECFCDGCWRLLHSHGKRCFHPYSEVSSEGRIDSRVYTMDGEQLSGAYDVSAHTQTRADVANASDLAATHQSEIDANTQFIERPASSTAGYDQQQQQGYYDYSYSEDGQGAPAQDSEAYYAEGYDNNYGSAQGGGGGSGEGGEQSWEVYYDEQGYPYYYNALTGQSQYENPYEYAT